MGTGKGLHLPAADFRVSKLKSNPEAAKEKERRKERGNHITNTYFCDLITEKGTV